MDGVEGFRLLLTIPLSGEPDNDAPMESETEEDCDSVGAANVTGQECSQCRFEDERRERQKRWMPPASNLSKYLLQSSNSITNRQIDLCPPALAPACSRLCPRHCPPDPSSQVPRPTFKSVGQPDFSPPHTSFQRSLPHPRRPQQSERIQPTFEPKRRAQFRNWYNSILPGHALSTCPPTESPSPAFAFLPLPSQ